MRISDDPRLQKLVVQHNQSLLSMCEVMAATLLRTGPGRSAYMALCPANSGQASNRRTCPQSRWRAPTSTEVAWSDEKLDQLNLSRQQWRCSSTRQCPPARVIGLGRQAVRMQGLHEQSRVATWCINVHIVYECKCPRLTG